MSSIQGNDNSFFKFTLKRMEQVDNKELLAQFPTDIEMPAPMLLNIGDEQDSAPELEKNGTAFDEDAFNEQAAALEEAQKNYEKAVNNFKSLISSSDFSESDFKSAKAAVEAAGGELQNVSDDFSSLASDMGMSESDISSEVSLDVSSPDIKATEKSFEQSVADAGISPSVSKESMAIGSSVSVEFQPRTGECGKSGDSSKVAELRAQYTEAQGKTAAAREKVSNLEGQLSEAQGAATEARDKQTKAQGNLDKANKEVQNAQSKKQEADNTLNTARGNQSQAQQTQSAAAGELSAARADQNAKQAAFNDAQAAVDKQQGVVNNQQGVVDKQQGAVNKAQADLNTATSKADKATKSHNTATARLTAAQTNYHEKFDLVSTKGAELSSVKSDIAFAEKEKANGKEKGWQNDVDWAEGELARLRPILQQLQAEYDTAVKERDAALQELKDAEYGESYTAWQESEAIKNRDAKQATLTSEQGKLASEQGKLTNEQNTLTNLQGIRDAKQAELDAANANADAKQAEFDAADAKLNEANGAVAAAEQAASAAQIELDNRIAKRDEAQRQLDKANAQVNKADEKVKQIESELETAKTELSEAEKNEAEIAEKLKEAEEAAADEDESDDDESVIGRYTTMALGEEGGGISPFEPIKDFDPENPSFEIGDQPYTTLALGEEGGEREQFGTFGFYDHNVFSDENQSTSMALGEEGGGTTPFLSLDNETEKSEADVEELALKEFSEIKEQQATAQEELQESHAEEIAQGAEIPTFDTNIDFDELLEKYKKEIQG